MSCRNQLMFIYGRARKNFRYLNICLLLYCSFTKIPIQIFVVLYQATYILQSLNIVQRLNVYFCWFFLIDMIRLYLVIHHAILKHPKTARGTLKQQGKLEALFNILFVLYERKMLYIAKFSPIKLTSYALLL